MKSAILRLAFGCCAVLLPFTPPVSAATVNWVGGSGDWGDTTKWSGGALPGAADDVVIGGNGASLVVSHTQGADQVHSVTSQGVLEVKGGSLSVSVGMQMQAGILLQGGILGASSVTLANGVSIVASGGTLDGVTLNGTLDAGNTYSGIALSITNGLTLNGTMLVGNPTNTSWAGVIFQGSQSLAGAGSVVFGNASAYYNVVYLGQPGTTLTIAPGISIRGNSGSIGSGSGTFWSGPANVTVINNGIVSADVPGGTIALTALPFVNHGQCETPGGSLNPKFLDNTGQTNVSGSLSLAGGTVRGGVLMITNGASVIMQNVTLDGVTVDGGLDVGNIHPQITLVVTNGLTLNGTMLVGNPTNAAWASVKFQGAQTLDGNGSVVFGNANGYYNVMYLGLPGTTLTMGPGITIQGNNGSLGSGSGTFWGGPPNVSVVNNGTVSADVPGGTIFLNAQVFTNHGQCETPGGSLNPTLLDNSGQTNVSGGLNLSGGTVRGGVLQITNGASVVVQNVTLDGVTVNGALDAGNTYSQIRLTITNGLTLNGTMQVGNPTNASWAAVRFQGSQTVGGSGAVVCGNQSGYYNVLYLDTGGTALTLGPGITIRGNSGSIGSGAGTYWGGPANVGVVNYGTISAEISGGTITLNAQPFANHGQLQTPGGAINAGLVDNTGQTIFANTATKSLTLSGGTIRGGVILATNGASVIVQNVTLDGVTVNGTLDAGNTYPGILLTITNGLTLNGAMLVGNPTNSAWGGVRCQGTQTLGGIGSIVFGNQSGYYNTLSLGIPGSTLTFGPGITIRGQNGNVGTGSGTYWGGPANVAVINYGTISADVAGGTIALTAEPLFNHGQFQSPAGVLSPGLVDNTGRTIVADAATGSLNLTGGSIRGGTIATMDGAAVVIHSATLDGVTVNGILDVGNAVSQSLLAVTNGLTLNGTMLVGNPTNSSWGGVGFWGSQTLGGSGSVVFGNQSAYYNAIYLSLGQSVLTVGPGITLRGQNGSVGMGGATYWGGPGTVSVVNQGSFMADTAGGAISVTGQSLTNEGNLLAFQGATLNWAGDLAFNDQQILSSGEGATVQVGGDLTGNPANSDQYSPQGNLFFPAGAHSLQAMSRDLGAVSAGYVKNFAYGSISLPSGAKITLVPQTNAASTLPECVYVDSLVVAGGATLNLNGVKLYARLASLQGTVSGGAVSSVPSSGGTISFGSPVVGHLAMPGESDQWTFFGRAGQRVVVLAGTSSPDVLPPQLPAFSVQITGPSGAVLSTATNNSGLQTLALTNVSLPVDGVYGIQIQAAPGSPNATGNYGVALWDATPANHQLVVNQPVVGALAGPYSADNWSFYGVAGQQIQFQLGNVSSAGAQFGLQGPGAWTGFPGLQGSSGLVTLPAAGIYTLQAQATGRQFGIQYAFQLAQTAQTNLVPGSVFTGQLAGGGQAQLFMVQIPADGPVRITLNNNGTNNATELYARLGSPPTRGSFDFRAAIPGSASQQLFIPEALAGTYYVLVYAAGVASPGEYTLTVTSAAVFLSSVTPARGGTGANSALTLSGAGFFPGSGVALVSSSGTLYAAPKVSVDSLTQLTATFPAGSVPPGIYSVLVTEAGGGQAELTNVFQMVGSGQPQLQTRLVPPGFAGRHQPATLYVQYANTGNAPIPAPLLVVSGNLRPILALAAGLSSEQRQAGFWTASLPPGWANSVQFLACGQTPGLLQPGESNTVAIAYAGLQQPWDFSQNTVQFTLSALTPTNSSPIDWDALQTSMKPLLLNTDAWTAVWQVFTNRVGATWGGYVQALDDNAAWLGELGLNIADIGQLLAFELQQADAVNVIRFLDTATDASPPAPGAGLVFRRFFAENISSRYASGAFGRGWSHNWEVSLTAGPSGVVTVRGASGSFRTFIPDTRGGYFAGPGDDGVLGQTPAGGFMLREWNGATSAFTAAGQLDYVADPGGNRINCGYANGHLVTLTHSAGPQLTLAYDGVGHVTSVTDSAGQATTYSYDGSGDHLLSASYPGGYSLAYTYTDSAAAAANPALAHALTATTFPDGTHRLITYDHQGRLASAGRDGGAETSTFAYNAPGSVSITDAENNTVEYSFENHALPARFRNAAASAIYFSYDGDRHLTRVTDPDGHSVSAVFDGAGNLSQAFDASGHGIELAYEGADNSLASIIDQSGNVTKFANDSSGAVLSAILPDGSAESWAYDAQGSPLVWTNRRGQQIQVTRNAAGQIITKTLPDGRSFSYAYDPRGLLTKIVDSLSGISSIAYDARGLMTNVTYPDGNGFAFSYDAVGRRVSRAGREGRTLQYGYDSAGRLASLASSDAGPLVRYSYDAAGRLSGESKGNGTTTTYTYDGVGRVLSVTNASPAGAVISFFNYRYDERGNRVSMMTATGTTAYTYDGLNQLTGVLYPGGRSVLYSYDPLGNRTAVNDGGTNAAYAANDLNQYSQAGGVSFAYDADGNLVRRNDASGASTYVYDAENRLISVSTPTNGVWQYLYDAFGNRAAVIRDGVTKRFLYDPDGFVDMVAEYAADGSLTARFDHGLGLVSRSDPAGATVFYSYDAHGNTREITGTNGLPLNTYDYTPFGEPLQQSESVANPFQFSGRFGTLADGNGLHFMRTRFYSASEGRFISTDPLSWQSGRLNLMSYCDNNPVLLSDPLGLSGDYDEEVYAAINKALAARNGNYFDAWQYLRTARDYNPRDLVLRDAEHYMWNAWTVAWPGSYGGILRPFSFYWWTLQTFGYSIVKEDANIYGAPFGYQTTTPPSLDEIDWGLRGAGAGLFATDAGNAPGPAGPAQNVGNVATGISASGDPNQLTGPAGYAAQNFVLSSGVFGYQILFENETNATAPAQIVQVSDPLSTNLNWSTFGLTEIAFGGQSLQIPPNTQHFQTNLPASQNGFAFQIQIEAGIRLDTGEVFANFFSVDPATGLPPPVNIGFLLPEDGTGRGVGQVSYVVQPYPGLPAGLVIMNVAFIQFDVNPVIATDQVNPHDPSQGIDPAKQAPVTIDGVPPGSSVLPLAASQSGASFAVAWAGTDPAGPGIGSFNIFVSTNQGPFESWLAGVTNTSAVFNGQLGQNYGFYSVAVDYAGLLQPLPSSAQAATVTPLPSLQAGLQSGRVVITWPAEAPTFILESTDALSLNSIWTPLTNGVTLVGDSFVSTNTVGPGALFYRLRQP